MRNTQQASQQAAAADSEAPADPRTVTSANQENEAEPEQNQDMEDQAPDNLVDDEAN